LRGIRALLQHNDGGCLACEGHLAGQ
jgi:hypothetical protein